MRRFALRLTLFLLPFLLLYSVPLAVTVPSGEIMSADAIAKAHAKSPPESLYGPAYTNPDKRYKLVSLTVHDAPVTTIGTSRVLQFCASYFEGGEKTFYNAGGLISRLSHFRRAFAHLPKSTRFVILGLDQWSYNDNWAGAGDDPGVETEYGEGNDALGNLRMAVSAWPDFIHGKLPPGKLLAPSIHFGINARIGQNGFRRDGSYQYTGLITKPEEGYDYHFKETLSRIQDLRQRFEGGAVVSEHALAETRLILEDAKKRGITVVAVMPPFAPTIREAMRKSGHHQYLDALPAPLQKVFDEAQVPLFDFTSCDQLGCTDAEFVDGYHGGDTVYARLTLEMAKTVPWLQERVLATSLKEQIAKAHGAELPL